MTDGQCKFTAQAAGDRMGLRTLLLQCEPEQFEEVVTHASELLQPAELARLLAVREKRIRSRLADMHAFRRAALGIPPSLSRPYERGLIDGRALCLRQLPWPIDLCVGLRERLKDFRCRA
jgi:hypothetical protein